MSALTLLKLFFLLNQHIVACYPEKADINTQIVSNTIAY